jgi:DNA-directed RNA polymerase specialized sigma24 family protein
MVGPFRSEGPFRLNPVDRLGRTIDPAVLAAAEEIGERAVEYADRILADPALAMDLLEQAAAAVSRVVARQRHGEAAVHNLQAYLFRAFIRKVDHSRRKALALAESLAREYRRSSVEVDFDARVLLNEFLMQCDPITRDMLYRRNLGQSWKQIGGVYGITAHAAESRFSKALKRVRKRLGFK